MKICLLTQDGISKLVEVSKDFSAKYYQEVFLSNSNMLPYSRNSKPKKKIFQYYATLVSGLKLFIEVESV